METKKQISPSHPHSQCGRQKVLVEHAACRQVSRLLGHEREDVTRIYLASLREGGE